MQAERSLPLTNEDYLSLSICLCEPSVVPCSDSPIALCDMSLVSTGSRYLFSTSISVKVTLVNSLVLSTGHLKCDLQIKSGWVCFNRSVVLIVASTLLKF